MPNTSTHATNQKASSDPQSHTSHLIDANHISNPSLQPIPVDMYYATSTSVTHGSDL